MNNLSDWFQLNPIPASALTGFYNPKLVFLSYLVAVLASYVALNFAGQLRAEQNLRAKIYWLSGGAFAMGAGIWSMHFIGMLAFFLPMPMEYELTWTVSSLLVAMFASAFALFILQKKNYSIHHRVLGGFIIGLAISTMHYMGMEGMKDHIQIHYLPGLFFLSIAVGIGAAETALWLALESNYGSNRRQFNLKIFSSLIMGVAICGMHYTGMSAAIFTPNLSHQMNMEDEVIQPKNLAFFVAGVTILIISLALIASTYYRKMLIAIGNEKEFLNAMLDNLEDGIIACDANGKITVLNHTLQKNINSEKNNSHINNILESVDFFTIDNKKVNQDSFPLQRALDGEKISNVELKMQFKNGVSRDVIINGQKIINAGGNNLGAVAVVHDITELKRTEKLKNEFVSIVSHELRTPLTSIRGSLGLLVNGIMGDFPDKAKKLLEIANSNCERLLLLINDILDIEKIEAGKMDFDLKVVNINHVINEAIEANKMYAEKYSVSIDFNPVDSEIYVRIDSARLIQVMSNLISNACKFSKKDDKISILVKLKKNWVRVSVIDHGPGMSPEFQSRIFQKFSQEDSSDTRGKSGTGLGLNISKTIIEKLEGNLGFTTKQNKGTTFYFDLPVVNEQPILIDSTCKELPEFKRRLLVCEDDQDQSNYIRVLLESANFVVDIASTVAEAKQLLKMHDYQALLLDLILPDQDGISFIRELRTSKKTSNLHIIVLSVIAQTGRSLLNGDAVSVVDWLDKPIDLNKLLGSITRIKKKNPEALPHILHIEDNVDTQHILGILLEKYAHLSTANNLKQANELLEKNKYDLIILDLLLPDGNGLEILPLLAKHSSPVLVFSDMKLNDQYAHYVSHALLKSSSTNEILLESIKKLL